VKIDAEEFALAEGGAEKITTHQTSAVEIAPLEPGSVAARIEKAGPRQHSIDEGGSFQIGPAEVPLAQIQIAIRPTRFNHTMIGLLLNFCC